MARTLSKIRFILLPLFCVVWRGVVFSQAEETQRAPWPHVRTTFPGKSCMPGAQGPCFGYAEQPRTQADLLSQGWIQISSCADNHPNFPGDRYVRSFNDKDIVIIMDGNGYIAGMQSVVMKEYTKNNENYDFTNNPFYILDDWNGEAAYFATAYFVDTSIICNGGRTEEEFQSEGTGNRLSFQNGPSNTNLMEVPTTEDELLSNGEWYKHLCVPNMGLHYMRIAPNVGSDYNCSNSLSLAPLVQILYSGGSLTGFVFGHFAEMPVKRYEDPHELVRAIPLTVDRPPQCMVDQADQHIVRSMHVWVSDYLVQCEAPKAQETYKVPLVPVPKNPFESVYQYPLEGNGFKENGTHVFWPSNRKVFSKFYINMAIEKETLFGISEQMFIDSGNPNARAGATLGTNDHLAFVKVVGPWNDGTSDEDIEESSGYSAMDKMPLGDEVPDKTEESNRYSPMDQMPLEMRLQNLKMKIGMYFQWYQVANISTLLHQQTMNPAQIMQLAHAVYNSESELLEKKLLAEMEEFSSGLSHDDYHQFDKSALMCLHMNPGGSTVTIEEDGATGWWLPLKHNLVAWRSMGYQQPLTQLRTTAGLMSMTIESGNLNVVFHGNQMWRMDLDGLDFTNMQIDISPPNELPPYKLPDLRPKPPALPMEPLATGLRDAFKRLPNDYNLPWLPRDQLCSETYFNTTLQQLGEACGYPLNPTEACLAAFADFYPCFNFLLRPSRNHDHGMDTMIEFSIILHVMSESPPWYWAALAIDKPWDVEFAYAVDVLGLDG